MAEFLSQIVAHTPLWVWAIFIFLLSRGIKARKPATVTLEKLAIIPAIFLIWDLYDLLTYRGLSLATCALWLVGLLSGAAMGYILLQRTTVTRGAAPRTLHRSPDYTALPFMMLAFAVKYVLGVLTAISPATLERPAVSAFAIIAGGVFAGVFVGKFTRYVAIYLAGEVQAAR